MTDGIDFRVKPGFFTHFKTGRLISSLDYEGVVKLLCLWGWAAEHRPSGVLSGMTGDDIEFAVAWTGQKGLFVNELVRIGWLDIMDDGVFCLHDWQEHNPWVAGAPLRSDMGRMGKLASDYPEIYAKFAAAGIRSISKKDYEMEVSAYKMRKANLSNSGYPHAPATSPKPTNNDLDQKDQPNRLADGTKDPETPSFNPNVPVTPTPNKADKENEDITGEMIPEGMTTDDVKKIRREIKNSPDFAALPSFLQEATMRVMPFAVANDREAEQKTAERPQSPSHRVPGSRRMEPSASRAIKDTDSPFLKAKAVCRSFPGYRTTANEDDWLAALCQDTDGKAHIIIREARDWVKSRNISVKNARGFITRWVKRVLKERETETARD